jgi:putative FmdB family regulatory protein
MPLYEYECKKCERRVEKIQKFSDPPLTTCENCGGALERLISSPTIKFKGSGWYVTDYAHKPYASGIDSSADSSHSAETKGTVSTKPSETAKASPSKG